MDLRSVFADRQIRCTRQRMDVYEALASTKSHPTAEQIHRMVQDREPGISLATVYNTLEALCSAGLAKRLSATEGPARFDADMSDHMHVVTDSGDVMDVPGDLADEIRRALPAGLRQQLETRLGASIGRLNLELGSKGSD